MAVRLKLNQFSTDIYNLSNRKTDILKADGDDADEDLLRRIDEKTDGMMKEFVAFVKTEVKDPDIRRVYSEHFEELDNLEKAKNMSREDKEFDFQEEFTQEQLENFAREHPYAVKLRINGCAWFAKSDYNTEENALDFTKVRCGLCLVHGI